MDLYAPPSLMSNLEECCHKQQTAKELVCPRWFLWSVCCSSMLCLSLGPCALSSQEEAHQEQLVLLGPLVPLGLLVRMACWLLVLLPVCPKWFLWWVCCSSMLCLSLGPCALSSQEEAHQEQLVLLGPLVPLGLLVRMACWLLVLRLVCPKWFLWWVCCSSMLCLLRDPCALSSQEEAHQEQLVLLGPLVPLGLLVRMACWLLVLLPVCPKWFLWWVCCSSMLCLLWDPCALSSQEEAHQEQLVLLGPLVPLGLLVRMACWLLVLLPVCPKWFLWWVCCSSMLCLLWDPCAPSSQEEAHQEQLPLLGPLVPLGLLVRMACWLLVLRLVCPKWFLWWVCCSSMLCRLWDPCALSSQEEAHQEQLVLLGPLVPLGLLVRMACWLLVLLPVCPKWFLWWVCCSSMLCRLWDPCALSSQEEAHQEQLPLLGPLVPLGLLVRMACWLLVLPLVCPKWFLWWVCCSSMLCLLWDPCALSSQEEAHQEQLVLLGQLVLLLLLVCQLLVLRMACPKWFLWWPCCSSMLCLLLDLHALSSQEEAHQEQLVLLAPIVPLEPMVLLAYWVLVLRRVCPKWFLWWVCCSSMLCLSLDPCALSSQEEAHQEQLVLLGPLVPLGLLVRMVCWLLVLQLVCPKWFLWSVCCSSTLCLSLDLCAPSSQEEGHQG